MRKGTNCSICDKELYAKNYCRNHYENNRRCGDPLGVRYKTTSKTCSTEGCLKPYFARGMCRNCYSLDYYHNRPLKPVDTNHPSAKAVPGYEAAHSRIKAARGHAKNYICECGCGKRAENWALRAGTENLYYAPMGNRGTKTAYSLNPYDYDARTADCHKRYDAETGNRNYKHKKRDAA